MSEKPIVEIVPIESLQPDPNNANRGTERGYYMLTDSVQERGAARSIWATSDGVVKGGNKTHRAAIDVGIEEAILVHSDGSRLVVVVRDDLVQGDPVADRLAIEDNRIGQASLEFDPAILLEMGKEDATLTDGLWRDDEWEELLGDLFEPPDDEPPPLAQMDKADELQEKWQVSSGDVWQCGPHFIICADCREPATWARLLALAEVEKVNGVFTSPPYWVGKEYEKETSWDEIQSLICRVSSLMSGNTHKSGRIIINTGTCPARKWFGTSQVRLLIDDWQKALTELGWPMRYVRCWAKRGQLPLIAPKMDVIDTHWEFIGYFYNPENKPFIGQRRVGKPWATDGIWDDVKGDRSAGGIHVAAYPVEIPHRNILLFSDPGDVWIDPFLGSATTICAAHQNERVGLGIERLEKYVSVCLERLSQLDLVPIRIESQ